jgi:hypothetical protein
MDNITTLERKLAACKAGQASICTAKYPTGIVIDLKGPEGNVFYILGVCKRLCRDCRLSADEIAEYDQGQKQCQSYDQILDHCQKWFGLVYIGRND